MTVDIGLAASEQAGRFVETVAGLLYVATPANPYFVGPEPLEVTADVVRRSRGPSGSNVEYVLELECTLAAMGAADPEVSALAERVRVARPRPTRA